MASSGSPHRSRKKQKTSSAASPRDSAVTIDPKTNAQIPAFPLASFFWPARKATSQWVIIPLVLIIVGLFRWCAGLWGYSGYETPPMHGDYEAQRHWMEITTHLPMSEWYFYDLEYWGLDYPPLTAYHSWLLGKIGAIFSSSWFELYTSRGVEDQALKVFMRATVIVSEYLAYIPPVVLLTRQLGHTSGITAWESSIALVAILMQPSTILIDHAHFQYNTVMLGFVLYTLYTIQREQYAFACAFFVLALGYKQMALYYAPAIFFYLLGSCLLPQARPLRFLSISLATVASFALVLAPLVLGTAYDQYRKINAPLDRHDRHLNPLLTLLSPYTDPSAVYYPYLLQITQLIHRIFPFARGIFEDKVANLWCLIHTAHKLHAYPQLLLQRLATIATLFAIQPTCMLISLYPRRNLLPWALASCSWGFYLCSFQVHEKSVLLPLLPTTILLSTRGGLGTELRAWIGWANMLGLWTLFPLLKRDELKIPYYALGFLWSYLLALPPTSLSCYFTSSQPTRADLSLATKLLHLSFYAIMLGWHLAEAFFPPPTTKPDLYTVINCIVGCAGFGICYLWTTWQLVLRSNVLEEWFGYRTEQDSKAPNERAKALPWNWYWAGKGSSDGSGKGAAAKGEKQLLEPKKGRAKAGREATKSLSPTPGTGSLSPTPEPGMATRRSPRKKK